MKRWIITAIACGVWLSGISSAAALTYVLDRPLVPPATSLEDARTRHASDVHERRALLDSQLLVAVRPVARSTPPSRARPTPPPLPRDITQMTCAPPRELDMGSGRVQICE